MTTNVPLHIQIEYMLCELDNALTLDSCENIYKNYLNLYRNEYPKAKRYIARHFYSYMALNKHRFMKVTNNG